MPPHPPDQPAATALPPVRRALLIALGWTAFALGIVGVVLPVVPTTPFMLVALWAFSLGSERFHGWLYHHRIFGPPLQRWRRERTVPRWAKVVALGSMAASLTWLAIGARVAWWVLV
ncbi:MAG TPA: YbaN family protein, partial [Anaeromyxobacteraceae bacterium]|nr:YbaN family protein [Anaeromyxobacteraceae bacterium]